jgi:TetR/AcrR family tetracycline transcriptional repressor
MDYRRHPGQRAGLDRDAVVAAARDLIARDGFAALSMRRLAGVLGVAPNALYSHVAGREELIDLLLDEALADVEVPSGDVGAVDGLRQVMTSTYRLLLRQPDLVPQYLARQGARGPHAQRLGGILTALLAEAGVPSAARQPAVRVLIVHTVGSAAFAVPAAGTHALGAEQLDATFRDGLGWLLAGIVTAD